MAIKKGIALFWTGISLGLVGVVGAPMAIYFTTRVDEKITTVSMELNEAISKIKSKEYTTQLINKDEITAYKAINGNGNEVDENGFIQGDVVSKLGLDSEKEFNFSKFENITVQYKLKAYMHNTKLKVTDDADNTVEKNVSAAEIEVIISYNETDFKRTKIFKVFGFQYDPIESVMRDVTVFPTFNPNKDKVDLEKLTTAELDNNGELKPIDANTTIYKDFNDDKITTSTGGMDFLTEISAKNVRYPQSFNYPSESSKAKVNVKYAFWRAPDRHNVAYTYNVEILFEYQGRQELTKFQIHADPNNVDNIHKANNGNPSSDMTSLVNVFKTKIGYDDISKKAILESDIDFSKIQENMISGKYAYNHFGIDGMFGLKEANRLGKNKESDFDNSAADIIDEAFGLVIEDSDYIEQRKEKTFKIIFSVDSTQHGQSAGAILKIKFVVSNSGKEDPMWFAAEIKTKDYDDSKSASVLLNETKTTFTRLVRSNISENVIDSLPRIGTNVAFESFSSIDLTTLPNQDSNDQQNYVGISYDVIYRNPFTFQAQIQTHFYKEDSYSSYTFVISYSKAILLSQKQQLIDKYAIVNSNTQYTDKNIAKLPDGGTINEDKTYSLSSVLSDYFTATSGVSAVANLKEMSGVGNEFKRIMRITLSRYASGLTASEVVEFVVYYPKAELNARLDNFKQAYKLEGNTPRMVELGKDENGINGAGITLKKIKNNPKYQITSGRQVIDKTDLFKKDEDNSDGIVDEEKSNVSEKYVITKFDDVEEATANVTATFTIGTGANQVNVTYSFVIFYAYDKSILINEKLVEVHDSLRIKFNNPNDSAIYIGEVDTRIDFALNTLSNSSWNSLSALRSAFGGDGYEGGKGIPALIQTATIPKNVVLKWDVEKTLDKDTNEMRYGSPGAFGRSYTVKLEIDYSGFSNPDYPTINKQEIGFTVNSSNYYTSHIEKVEGEINKIILFNDLNNVYSSSYTKDVLNERLLNNANKNETNLHSVLGNSNLYIARVKDGTTGISVLWSQDQQAIVGEKGAIYQINIKITEGLNVKQISFYIKTSDYVELKPTK